MPLKVQPRASFHSLPLLHLFLWCVAHLTHETYLSLYIHQKHVPIMYHNTENGPLCLWTTTVSGGSYRKANYIFLKMSGNATNSNVAQKAVTHTQLTLHLRMYIICSGLRVGDPLTKITVMKPSTSSQRPEVVSIFSIWLCSGILTLLVAQSLRIFPQP